jgi:hypothetical protein
MSQLEGENHCHVVLSKALQVQGQGQPSVRGLLVPASREDRTGPFLPVDMHIGQEKFSLFDQSPFSPNDTFLEIHMIIIGESYSAAEYNLRTCAISGVAEHTSGKLMLSVDIHSIMWSLKCSAVRLYHRCLQSRQFSEV